MARNKERLDIVLNLITDKLRGSARQASAAMRGIGNSAKQAVSPLRGVGTRLSDISVGSAAVGSAAFIAARKFVQFTKDSVNAASDLIEASNAVEKVFGNAADTILDFGKVSAQAAGLSNREFRELSTEIGALLQNFGFSAEQAARETIKLTLRATDMASIFNTDVRQALEAIGSALRQETRPIRRFGVSLSDAEIRARAVADGMADTTAEVTRNQKAFAALDLIYEQTDKTAGDFIDTSTELANAQRIQQATTEDLSAAFGEALIPVVAESHQQMSLLGLEFLNMTDNVDQLRADTLAVNVFAGMLFGGPQWGTLRHMIQQLRSEYSGAAGEALAFRDAMDLVNGILDEGGGAVSAFDAAVVHLVESGIRPTAAQILALATGSRLARQALPQAMERLLEFGEAAGWTAAQMSHVRAAIENVKDPIDQLADVGDANELERLALAARPAADGIEEVGEESDEAADHVQEMLDNVANLRKEFLNAANPVRRAADALNEVAKAEAEYQKLLEASEGGEITQEIASAWLDVNIAQADAQAALDELNLGYEEALRLLLATSDMSMTEIERHLAALGIFPDVIVVDIVLQSNITGFITNFLSEIGQLEGFFGLQPAQPLPPTGYIPVNPDAGFQASTGISNSASTTIVFNGDVVSDDITGDVTTAMTVASIANSRVF